MTTTLKPVPNRLAILRPRDIEQRYGISVATRCRWEAAGKLPPRDFYIGGDAIGWRLSTLEAMERGEYRAPGISTAATA
jgi:predicted DNA-binding transcriptional regulator AlpA